MNASLPNQKKMDTSTILVLGSAIAFVLLFVYFFPSFYTAIDEHEYAKNALLLVQGSIKNADPLNYCGGTLRDGDYISPYSIGKSLMLIPFLSAPFPFLMVSGLIIHLLNTFIFFHILRKRKIDARWTILFLFYPSFVYESRTLFAEIGALTLVLAGVYYFLDSKPRSSLLAGLFFGSAVLVRYETALIAGAFAIPCIWRDVRAFIPGLKKTLGGPGHTLYYLAGCIIPAIGLLAINTWLYGSAGTTSYGSPSGLFSFIPISFLPNLIEWIGILLVAYPLMLVLPLKDEKLRVPVGMATGLTLLLFALKGGISAFPFWSPLTFTARMRYLIPIAGLLMVSYVFVLDGIRIKITGLMQKDYSTLFFVGMAFLLILGGGILSYYHAGLVNARGEVHDQLTRVIPNGALVIGSSDDCIYFMQGLLGTNPYVSIASDYPDPRDAIAHATKGVYVMSLSYSNKSDSAIRQGTIDRERKKIQDFVKENANYLELVYQTNEPHDLNVYKYAP